MGEKEVKKEPASASAISEAALKVFTREELTQMPRALRMSLGNLIGNRLDESHKPPPTVAKLEGIKELLLEHLSHPALGALSKSPTPPSWPSQEVMEARLDKAIEQFKKDTAGKSWDDLANELEAKNRAA